MSDYNNITDKSIHDLLKRRLLEQDGNDDLLTQKLIDMEAKLVFSDEALVVPSLQKEKELFKKLQRRNYSFLKWLLPLILLAFGSSVFLYRTYKVSVLVPEAQQRPAAPAPSALPSIRTDTIESTDSTYTTVSKIVIKKSTEDLQAVDSVHNEHAEKWLADDPGIKPDNMSPAKKHDPKFVDAYDHIPVLSPKQIALNNKQKEKMVRQLIKRDKSAWILVRMGTDMLAEKKISYYAFYVAATEVTNNQYRIFLNDLLINDKIDDYMKAVPDTTKWRIESRKFYDPMVNMYFWHPAYNDFPVLNISREGAKMYCDWLTNAVNEKVKKEKSKGLVNDLRIPNEIEWVAAARGGLGNVDYPWTISPEKNTVQNAKGCYLCNFSIVNYPDSLRKRSGCSNEKLDNAITSAGSVSGEFYFTAKVNSYNPNVYGLYCVSGNAAEMVWEDDTHKAITKGGSWNSDAEHVKINAKENEGVTEASPYIGFRPVFTAMSITINE